MSLLLNRFFFFLFSLVCLSGFIAPVSTQATQTSQKTQKTQETLEDWLQSQNLLFPGAATTATTTASTSSPSIQFVPVVSPAMPVTKKADELVLVALSLQDTPYHRGGTSQASGFDCSGLVRHVVQQVWGLLLPHRAREQAQVTRPIDHSDVQPGDLVFFNTRHASFSHVGIYVGDGRFIHAPRRGRLVRLDHWDEPYWRQRFDGARRVDSPDTPNSPPQLMPEPLAVQNRRLMTP